MRSIPLTLALSSFTLTASGFLPMTTLSSRRGGVFCEHPSQTSVLKERSDDNAGEASSRRRFMLTGLTTAATISWGGWSQEAAAEGGFLSGLKMPGGGGGGGSSNDAKNKKRLGGVVNKIRDNVGHIMDELQRDLMQERWDLVESYPAQLRSYVPVFTTYTDSAFPSDIPTDKGLRVALRYEVGRFFAALERFRQAASRKALDEAYVAYGDMSLHLDRYMRVGGIYTYYDDTITNEPYFAGINERDLVYADPKKHPAEVRDLIILCKGPDKGKTGILIALSPDGSNTSIVKLDRIKGMREIKVVPRNWVAKRLGEQEPDDVFLIPRS